MEHEDIEGQPWLRRSLSARCTPFSYLALLIRSLHDAHLPYGVCRMFYRLATNDRPFVQHGLVKQFKPSAELHV
jgi:hypothetical protein